MITNIHKNIMGTVSFDGKFKGMRKAQDFIVYPVAGGADAAIIQVQSSTRIGRIDLKDGKVTMSPPVKSGAYGHHLALATEVDQVSSEDLLKLKASISATANARAGTNGLVYTDNSGAISALDH